MLISPQERLGIFIDGADLLAASRVLGFCVDFRRLRSLFQQRGKLMRTIFYAALSEDDKGCLGLAFPTARRRTPIRSRTKQHRRDISNQLVNVDAGRDTRIVSIELK